MVRPAAQGRMVFIGSCTVFVSVTLLGTHHRQLIDLVGAYFQGGRIL